VDREDVRMDEVGEDVGFLLEARSELRVGGEQLGEELERDEDELPVRSFMVPPFSRGVEDKGATTEV
jgi:hypothetical protein